MPCWDPGAGSGKTNFSDGYSCARRMGGDLEIKIRYCCYALMIHRSAMESLVNVRLFYTQN